MRDARFTPLATLLAAAALGAACPGSNVSEVGCESDRDCGDFRRCDSANGVCRCTDDSACDGSEFCNLAGSCQPKTECLTDGDCRSADNPAAICDTRTPHPSGTGADDNVYSATAGQCVTLSAQVSCLMDSHCPYGFFCQASQCTPGCKDDGDCPLGDPCINGSCDPTPGACNGNGFCEYGEICQGNVCRPHADAAVLCQRCDPTSLGNQCSEACLIDNSIAPTSCDADTDCARGTCLRFPCYTDAECPVGTCQGAGLFPGECSPYCGDFFCGSTDCDDAANPCPRGYSCYLLVSTSDVSCTRGGGECPGASTCSADLPGENQQTGFCSCGADVGCPAGRDCVNGGCLIGSTCGPQDGLLCQDVL